jgi:hypothetical protein
VALRAVLGVVPLVMLSDEDVARIASGAVDAERLHVEVPPYQVECRLARIIRRTRIDRDVGEPGRRVRRCSWIRHGAIVSVGTIIRVADTAPRLDTPAPFPLYTIYLAY